jgi:hypothetical protein
VKYLRNKYYYDIMRSLLKNIFLIGFMIFGIATIWSGYWALVLQRDGYRVTVKIIAHTGMGQAPNGVEKIWVDGLVTDKSGYEGKYGYESDNLSAPGIGTVVSFYLLSGPVTVRSGWREIPGNWYYSWASPILSFFATCAFTMLWLAMAKYNNIIFKKSAIAVLILLLITVIYLNPLMRIINIREYVLAQRENNQALEAQRILKCGQAEGGQAEGARGSIVDRPSRRG